MASRLTAWAEKESSRLKNISPSEGKLNLVRHLDLGGSLDGFKSLPTQSLCRRFITGFARAKQCMASPMKTLLIVLTVWSSYASAVPDEPGKVVQFGMRRLTADAHGWTALDVIKNLYRDLGSPELPPYAIRYVRELDRHRDEAKAKAEFVRYEAALKYYVGPPGENIPGLSLEAAHSRAVEMIWRRPTLTGVDFEIGMFKQMFVMNRLIGLSIQRSRDDAFESAPTIWENQDTPPVPKRADPMEKRVEFVMRRLDEVLSGLGRQPTPPVLKAHAHGVAGAHAYIEDVTRKYEGYLAALSFGVRSLAEAGPELSLEAAHQRAAAMPEIKADPWIQGRFNEVYEATYRRLLAPIAEEGFALSPEMARDQALDLTDRIFMPDVETAMELLNRRRTLPPFFTMPIRDGGLGLAEDQVAATLAIWEEEFPAFIKVARIIPIYRQVLARYLARAIETGEYDEPTARDQALSRLKDYLKIDQVMAQMDTEGFPRVTLEELPPLVAPTPEPPPKRGPFQFAKDCVAALLPRGPGPGAK